jgi:hypothetical protein
MSRSRELPAHRGGETRDRERRDRHRHARIGLRRRPLPDLSGTTVGTWRVLYEAKDERKRHCMCRCVRCGVKKIILSFKLREQYALRCPECRIRQQLTGA